MAKKQFKAESKRLMDLMINSIYTHKEIFLREIISNASDAEDKLAYRALTDDSVEVKRKDLKITIVPDKEKRTLTVSDNGVGMTKDELESNLGTIAKSGSLQFKQELERDDKAASKVDVIGQFGVGFYSAFMVADAVTVISRAYGAEEAWMWQSAGTDGYTVTQCEKETPGTDIIMHIKPNADEENYDQYLETYKLQELIKKYRLYPLSHRDGGGGLPSEGEARRRRRGLQARVGDSEGVEDPQLHGAPVAAAEEQSEAGGVQRLLQGEIWGLAGPPDRDPHQRRGRRHLQGHALYPLPHPLRLLYPGV